MARVFEAFAHDGILELPRDISRSARCLVTVLDEDVETLRKQAEVEVSEARQRRLGELLLQNRDGKLSRAEKAELDALAAECEATTLAKARALRILAHLGKLPPPYRVLARRKKPSRLPGHVAPGGKKRRCSMASS
jgi:hypothetical protein